MRHAIILVALLCASCSSTIPSFKPYRMDIQQGNVVTSKMMLQLRPGMSKSQVRFIMGTPLIQDSFHKNRWDYFYQMSKAGKVIEQRRVILDFENDQLKGVRGDVIGADSAEAKVIVQEETKDAAEAAAIASAAAAKAEEKKSLADKLKFWKKDEVPAQSVVGGNTNPKDKLAAPEDLVDPSKRIPVAPAGVESTGNAAAVVAPAAVGAAAAAQQPAQRPATPAAPVAESAAPVAVAAPSEQQQEVTDRVIAWADAWRKKDADAYFAFYADKFSANGVATKKAWVAQRKARFAKAGNVTLSVEDIVTYVDGNKANVEFIQKYTDARGKENITKLLMLERINGAWLIVRESKVAARSPAQVPANVEVKPMQDVDKLAAPAALVVPELSPAEVQQAVTARVAEWAEAWRSKDVNRYLSFYADSFKPQDMPSRKSWVELRKKRLARPGDVSLQLDNLSVTSDGKQATASFVQRYSLRAYKENADKQLVWQLIGGQWLIVQEKVSATAAAPAGVVDDGPVTPQLTPEQKSESMPVYPPDPAPAPVKPAAQDAGTAAPATTTAQPGTATPRKAPAPPPEPDDLPESDPSFFERMLEKIGF